MTFARNSTDILCLKFWNSVDSILTILHHLRKQKCKRADINLSIVNLVKLESPYSSASNEKVQQ